MTQYAPDQMGRYHNLQRDHAQKVLLLADVTTLRVLISPDYSSFLRVINIKSSVKERIMVKLISI